MENIITMENFGQYNRDRKIGNSTYRICRNGAGNWYIHEMYNDGTDWAIANGFTNKDLSVVIGTVNSFTKEREVVSLELEGMKNIFSESD